MSTPDAAAGLDDVDHEDAALAAALFAVDPQGLGGVALRAPAGAARDQWLALLKRLLPANTPLRRIPLNISDTALLGGLDLGATLQAGRPVSQQGVLAQSDGGVVMLAMAERLAAGMAARLAAVLDNQEVLMERDGLTQRRPARLGMVAFDEGSTDDEQMPPALLDRLALHLTLHTQSQSDFGRDWEAADISAARGLLPAVRAESDVLPSLCATALALGIDSLRAPLLALRVARAAAALSGLDTVGREHAAMAARLVLGPRATQLPPPQPALEEDEAPGPVTPDETPELPPPDQPDPPNPPDAPPEPDDAAAQALDQGKAMAETVLDAAKASIPAGLLAALRLGDARRSPTQGAGRSGALLKSQARGRPIGARRGEPGRGARINVIETLRAAAPWQRLRARQVPALAAKNGEAGVRRIHVRREDFHVTRFKQLGQTTTVFVVDASGSSALHRLAEAKGAVELLLADCYVRRDRVAVIAFRGKAAELLLPPTRSLARAKRSLAGLPGGGGTPLAAGLDAASELAEQLSRRGETPIVVLLTDGRANIARDGRPGRAQASTDAIASAQQFRQAGLAAVLLDTSPQPQPTAQALALAMGATYLPLPHAGAQLLSVAVRGAITAGTPQRAR